MLVRMEQRQSVHRDFHGNPYLSYCLKSGDAIRFWRKPEKAADTLH
jgi:hypothetical protein